MSYAIVSGRCVIALRLMNERSGVGRQMTLEEVCFMLVGLFLSEMVNMVKEAQAAARQEAPVYG